MKSKLVDNQPQEVTNYLEIDPKEQDAVECVNEIFNTPLKGSYNWDYTVVDDRIKKLYELGKKLNWNVSDDLDSVFYGCKYALPLMRDSGNGSIINISSISGIVAGHNFTAYNSAKAAVRHLSKSVALHCARTTKLVRCNSLHPVFAKTEILEALLSDTSNDMLSKLERQIPVRKLAEVEDIANAILFLASDESKMITGTEIVIDGGLSAQ